MPGVPTKSTLCSNRKRAGPSGGRPPSPPASGQRPGLVGAAPVCSVHHRSRFITNPHSADVWSVSGGAGAARGALSRPRPRVSWRDRPTVGWTVSARKSPQGNVRPYSAWEVEFFTARYVRVHFARLSTCGLADAKHVCGPLFTLFAFAKRAHGSRAKEDGGPKGGCPLHTK